MAREYEFEISSRLDVSQEDLWQHASSIVGVNRELFPLLRMTAPPGKSRLDDEDVELGTTLFRSWILLFGLLPVEYDDLCLVELERGRRFLERSRLLSQRLWVHERELRAEGERQTILSDRIRFVPRIALLGRLHLVVFELIFRMRHANLRRLFAGVAVVD